MSKSPRFNRFPDLHHPIELEGAADLPCLFGLARLDRVDAPSRTLVAALARFCKRDILARVGAVSLKEGNGFGDFCEGLRNLVNSLLAPRAGFEPATIRLTVENCNFP